MREVWRLESEDVAAAREAVLLLERGAAEAWRGPEAEREARPAGVAFDEPAWWLCKRAARRLLAQVEDYYRGGKAAAGPWRVARCRTCGSADVDKGGRDA